MAGLSVVARVWAAAPVSVRAAAEPSRARIGEPIAYRITVERPASVAVTWPEIGAELAGFSVEKMTAPPGLRRQDTRLEEREYRLVGFSTGEHEIPGPVVGYQEPGGEPGQARGPAVRVTLTSVLPQDADAALLDIRGIKPPVPLGLWRWWAIGLGLLLAGAGAAGWWLRRHPARASSGPPARPAHDVALEALERLRQEWLPSKGRYEEYYVRLSAIVRAYVEGRFGLRAPEMTTEEFLQSAAQAHALSAEQRQLLRDFLTHCDMVKFARYQPSSEEADEAFEAAQRFVEQTAERSESRLVGSSARQQEHPAHE